MVQHGNITFYHSRYIEYPIHDCFKFMAIMIHHAELVQSQVGAFNQWKALQEGTESIKVYDLQYYSSSKKFCVDIFTPDLLHIQEKSEATHLQADDPKHPIRTVLLQMPKLTSMSQWGYVQIWKQGQFTSRARSRVSQLGTRVSELQQPRNISRADRTVHRHTLPTHAKQIGGHGMNDHQDTCNSQAEQHVAHDTCTTGHTTVGEMGMTVATTAFDTIGSGVVHKIPQTGYYGIDRFGPIVMDM